jgi:hypothetical protein
MAARAELQDCAIDLPPAKNARLIRAGKWPLRILVVLAWLLAGLLFAELSLAGGMSKDPGDTLFPFGVALMITILWYGTTESGPFGLRPERIRVTTEGVEAIYRGWTPLMVPWTSSKLSIKLEDHWGNDWSTRPPGPPRHTYYLAISSRPFNRVTEALFDRVLDEARQRRLRVTRGGQLWWRRTSVPAPYVFDVVRYEIRAAPS